jgi:hypothetical protein
LAANAEVYKWVDKDGNVHFSDQKPEDQAEAETVDTSATELTEAQKKAAERRLELEQQSAIKSKAAQAELEKKKAEMSTQRKKDQGNRVANCEQGRRGLAISERSNRVYTTDDNGNRTYLSDDERVARIKRYRQIIVDYCD